ncbi:MAG TPA: NAD(P)-dependent oxidoreductase [Dongiaceae bacterium]|nr:NAD(P)-dependent oxidoreductase [Dongiaceae bacterium]
MTGQHFGFVGVGRMGGLMAGRLLDAGHTLSIFDTSEAALAPLVARGCKRAESAAAVASDAEVVFASLPTPAIVEQSALGGGGVINGTKIKTFVDMSTSGPRAAQSVAKGLAAKKIVALDAPVSGGLKGAREGTLAVMVSGPRSAYDAIEATLKNFGKLFFIGEKPGSAQTMKLVNNLLAACSLAITCEGMVMGAKAGLDAKTMIDVLNVSSGRSSATQDKFPRAILPRTFDFGFATGLSHKDVRLCLDEAEALGVPMIVGSAVRQVLAITSALYGPDSDFTNMVKCAEQWAGAEVRG